VFGGYNSEDGKEPCGTPACISLNNVQSPWLSRSDDMFVVKAPQYSPLVSHRSSAFLWVIRLMILATNLTAVLHPESRVIWQSFLNFCSCFTRRSKPSRSLFRSKSVVLLVYSLCDEAIEAIKSRGALSASSPELVWILNEINSEARL
jgi:hypothetical protein